jgi:hypothetical protein
LSIQQSAQHETLKKRRFKTGCDVKKDDRPDSLLHSQPAKHLFGGDIQGNHFGNRNDIATFAELRLLVGQKR